MEIHQMTDLVRRQSESGRAYLEFQRSDDLSTGLYVLAAGGTDRQQPHGEDEIYYVLAGNSRVTVGNEEATIGPGAVIFVAAGVPHRFHDITADLQLLVVFGPAEGSGTRALHAPADD
jgi:mannose-6-phosphate isomerase-like protein (cupin superfamily)